MKGIILAGGSGTRLYPMTYAGNKHLMPLFNKPMIYYSLSVLMLSKIKEVLIISTPEALPAYEKLFGNGDQLGINISYAGQAEPKGLAEAFIIGEEFIGDDSVCLILGDNIVYGSGLTGILEKSYENIENNGGAIVFGQYVNDPHRYGVLEFDKNKKVTKVIEKPENPPSNYAVIGLYYYDNDVINISKSIKPSGRGELEITDVNNVYLDKNKLDVELFPRGIAWFDAGTHESFLDASNYIHAIEKRMSLMVGCIEEIAYKNKWISKKQLLKLAKPLLKTEYGKYLERISNE
ncbi:Glucose-1-phosphate thymidylyltransferase [Methanococcus maripaludis C5]|uniref:glucose-1-phosphate thymidylyltransferase n=1 Tax=Methanococcus maripaludis (strain C5 / ATCC BAA-1333) TaxID=402880 RepID=A4FZH9_METM5|nr:glucose-1-phosphate thymidylyltransferase RfbA [Methanococcus maripaludis]ABO35613.1 Glucose-1-phosphate thymidylyltransferase [Methanococcus maripaludis C5]